MNSHTQSRIYSEQLPCYTPHIHNAEQICKQTPQACACRRWLGSATSYHGLLAPHMHAAWRDHRLQPSRSAPSCIRSYIRSSSVLSWPIQMSTHAMHGSMPSHRCQIDRITLQRSALQRVRVERSGVGWLRYAVAAQRAIYASSAKLLSPCCAVTSSRPLRRRPRSAPPCPPKQSNMISIHPLHSSPHYAAMSNACATALATSAHVRD